ncbi:MAG: DUF2946 family protein [Pseudolabrys sp.]
MRTGGKRVLTWAAIYAVALHAILLGVVSPLVAAQPNFDPLSAICHSVPADQASDQTPGQSGLVPGHACEHCNICAVYAPPVAPDDALAGILEPARVLDVLSPSSAAPRAADVSRSRLARGPPLFA